MFFSHLWLPNNTNGSKDISIRDCPRSREDEEEESDSDGDLFADLEDEVCILPSFSEPVELQSKFVLPIQTLF